MNYEIKLPAIAGDIIPISAVARAMALRDATAGGPGGLRATYDGRCAGYEAMLLKHVRSDSLAVCDDVGDCGKACDIVARRVADGSSVALLPDLRQVDEDTTWLMNLFVKLVHLNDWASRRGDAFTVSHEGVSWVEAAHHVTRDGVSHFDVRHRGTPSGVTPAETVRGVVAAAKTSKATQAANKVTREDGRLRECEAQGMVFDKASLLRLPDGIGKVARGLGIERQSLTTDVKAALERRFALSRNGKG